MDHELMNDPPRNPKVTVSNRHEVVRWLVYGVTLFGVTLVPLLWGPDELSVDAASASMTMAFVVMCIGTILAGLTIRRDPSSGLLPPILKALMVLSAPAALTVLATEGSFLQGVLTTQTLTGSQWLAVLLLALVPAIVIELDKAIKRARASTADGVTVEPTVAPERALSSRNPS
ncbi:MAG: cation transporting ATPase C-terminal domain-containing protein [Acidobacteria bacterium]|nr:cation transporting ATPase C-terminal domain-containing protein [Acidobacteriota bacterium]